MLEPLLKKLTPEGYAALVRGAEEMAHDRFGPRLLRLPGGRIVKLFRRRRLVSWGLLWPAALRFCRAARLLAERGIASVEVVAAYRLPSPGRQAVVYRELPGESLRTAAADPERRERLMAALAPFFARLHERGVYFRAGHLGNLIVGPGGELALVDLVDTWFHRAPLGPSRRARNFKPLLASAEDRAILAAFGLERFLGLYLAAAGLEGAARRRFLRALARRSLPLRDAATRALAVGGAGARDASSRAGQGGRRPRGARPGP